MKLFFCQSCHDIQQIRAEKRICSCGDSGGHLHDKKTAHIWGKAVPLGIHNHSFSQAMIARPIYGGGLEFTAFVIPKVCDTVIYSPLSEKP